jgi:hypothetical protein
MTIAAGWYADPSAPGRLRWWDGATWTATTAAAPHVPSATPPYDPHYSSQYGARQSEGMSAVDFIVPAERTMATRALVWGILSIPLFVAFPVPLLALVFGFIGLARARRLEREGGEPLGRARSIAGIVLGSVGALMLIAFILWTALVL